MAKKRKKQKAYNPAIDDGTSRPIRAAVAIGDPQDKYSEYPSSGLSPAVWQKYSGRRMKETCSVKWSFLKRWKKKTPTCFPSSRPGSWL